MSGKVVQIENLEQLNIVIQKLSNLIILDFGASWCGPCNSMHDDYKLLAEKNKDCIFLTIDVDENEELAVEFNIEVLPTFMFIKNNKILDTLVGAKLEELTSLIKIFKASEI